MKIKLTQPGYETFTGELGHIEFKDGLSVHDNPNPDFVRSLSGIVRVEQVPSDLPLTQPEGGVL